MLKMTEIVNYKGNTEAVAFIANLNNLNDESKMEVVKAFNNELVSLYDIKPPISKAKMTAITKAAMKSVKFYKHVIHGVEKFILKCRPDYKIPGLYVIDSIVRQSRHQFGNDKDVFAPRFSKNLLQTFKNICSCPEDDKQKLVRVINLWQKHKVFSEDLLEKFLVMAKATEEELTDLYKDEIETIQKSSKKSPSSGKKKKKSPKSIFENNDESTQNSFYSALNNSSLGMNSTPRLQSNHNDNMNKNSVDPALIQQLQTLTTLLQQTNVPAVNTSPAANNTTPGNDQVKFDKKLLEYDYGEEDDEAASIPASVTNSTTQNDSLTSILTNPEILRQLHNLQVQLSMAQAQVKQQQDQSSLMMEQQRIQQMQAFSQAMMMQQYQQDCNSSYYTSSALHNTTDDDADDKPEIIMEKHGSDPLEVIDLDHIVSPASDKSHRRSYSRSRSSSRSRSYSRSHRSRNRRSRSRSWNRENNEDRRRRALPPIKRKRLAVCSTTLWVGHLSKLVQEQDLSDTFGEYGDIVSIDLIPPRGCAFLCMNRRQDANRALYKLKNTKIHGKGITIAWAPGKGMKDKEWKDYWESDYGVSYIPWKKLTPETDYDLLEEGSMLDQETMPDWLKTLLEERHKGRGLKPKLMYTPSGTDMDESSNECDDNEQHSQISNSDMIIESTTNIIPLPDGPQPNVSSTHGIPLPPSQNATVSQAPTINLPPPNLLNHLGIPPRFLAPMMHDVLGGNFLPPLGVPPPVGPGLIMPPQQMMNRLPPPFNHPPVLPMMNPGQSPNTSLSQIPLPDSSTSDTSGISSVSAVNFKPPPFGLAPPFMFAGNPNMKLDLPGNLNLNPMSMKLGGDLSDANNESSNSENNDNLLQNAFKNLIPFSNNGLNFGNTTNSAAANRDRNEKDTDYRILGDISNANMMNTNSDEDDDDDGGGGGDKDSSGGGGVHDKAATDKHYRNKREDASYERDRGGDYDCRRDYRFNDRNQQRNFDNKDREHRYHDRNHRFSGRSPYREDSYDNDRYKSDRDSFRRSNNNNNSSNSRFDSRNDYKRGGRDYRGGRSRDYGGPLSSRSRPRSRDRDRYRDNRREYGGDNENKSRRFEKRGRSREKSDDDYHTEKKNRWSDAKTNDENAKVDDTGKRTENNDRQKTPESLEISADAATNEPATAVAAATATEADKDALPGSVSEEQNTTTDDAKAKDEYNESNNDEAANVTNDVDDRTEPQRQQFDDADTVNETPPPFHNPPVMIRFREPRSPFPRMPPIGRGGSPAGGHFGPNVPGGQFPGVVNFPRARFPGHRPPYFPGPMRHFGPFSDARPPRPFMPRSSDF